MRVMSPGLMNTAGIMARAGAAGTAGRGLRVGRISGRRGASLGAGQGARRRVLRVARRCVAEGQTPRPRGGLLWREDTATEWRATLKNHRDRIQENARRSQ